MRYLLSDIHYNAPNVREAWESDERFLITPQYGANPHDDEGTDKQVAVLESSLYHAFPELHRP